MSDLPNIIFMGTPGFAVPPLCRLLEAGYPVRLVVTQPDRPKGRGRQPAPPPVKIAALQAGLEVAQPLSVHSPETVALLRGLVPDLLVVVAYGQILPLSVLSIPRLGAVNIHGSLLPKYRGPAPIQWAMLHGERRTGVTTMLIDQGVDTGDLLLSRAIDIAAEETADSLHDRLSLLGADLLLETVQRMSEGTLYPTAQNHAQASYAPMLKKEDGRIDWSRSAYYLDVFIRAMYSWPGAFCHLKDKRLKIFRAAVVDMPHDSPPGMVLPGFADELQIATGAGALSILEIQGASGKRLPIRDFLRGHPLEPGTLFS